MGLSEKLTEIKSQTDALLSYANETTKAEDTRLGDAIRTLVDGFGGGSGGKFPFLPSDAEVVSTNKLIWNLGTDTSFKDITPSTTSQVIKNAGSTRNWFSITPDFDNYEYYLEQIIDCDFAFTTETPTKPYVPSIHGYKGTYIGRQNYAIADVLKSYSFDEAVQMYYTSSGGINSGGNFSQGFSVNMQVASVSAGVIGLSTPQLSVRAGTYMSIEAFNQIDADNTNIVLSYTIYRYAKGMCERVRTTVSE